ncbi:hypothetical protein B1729_09790 [Microbacterium sp. B35-04]|uniref:hypothetical protein n=1 Tax=Microbacterium sp. B35-04 TaxID=1961716 RepID=UPI0013D3012E|nr:hypothetical protein [Microbacterium sp. B35-04]KAF2413570.1 hypothetical protein B1729_09790 [Microbacterium sp. B35-04]
MSTPLFSASALPRRRDGARTTPFRGALLGALELLTAATVSMVLVDQITALVLSLLGRSSVLAQPAGVAVVMTFDVCAGTAVWMLARGRSNRSILGMVIVTGAAFALPLLPFWLGGISGPTAVLLGHVLVVPAIALLVAILPGDLASGRSRPIAEAPDSGIRLRRLSRRWPTLLALLLTFGEILHPDVAPPWALVVLGAEYLVIGLVRRQFRDRRLLTLHAAGALAYAALATLAVFVTPEAAGILIGIGWLLHAGWDVVLHRRNVVVWPWFAEACIVIDVVVGVTAIVATVAMWS